MTFRRSRDLPLTLGVLLASVLSLNSLCTQAKAHRGLWSFDKAGQLVSEVRGGDSVVTRHGSHRTRPSGLKIVLIVTLYASKDRVVEQGQQERKRLQ